MIHFISEDEQGTLEMRMHLLEQVKALTTSRIPTDSRLHTRIPYLTLNRYSQQTPPLPVVLSPSFCLVLQGSKKIHAGEHILFAREGDFLTSLIALPTTAQVNADTLDKQPYIGLRIDFTIQELASVITEARLKVRPRVKHSTAAFMGKADAELLALFVRLLMLLDKSEEEILFLSGLIKREMIFKLLSGEYGHLFFQQVFFDQQAEGVGKAIAWIKEHFALSFTVEELANATNMSVSGLHHKFKAVTAMGPLQYQKQLRLQEARRLLISGQMDVTNAALEVGYESSSQFNREYRRLFGLPPLKDIKAVKQHASAGLFEYGD
ncbi:AraC family transcriptional regulator [Paenibacillus macerans]|uniref:AraC family transcriptional regulator n=1 Tax=Paenibacillus macerans TaxID=44252 RepID=UPI003D31D8D9